MPHLLHIGMPKCMSSVLQDMFATDQSNFYLGMEPNDGVPKQVLYAVETELLQVPAHHYNESVVENLMEVAISTAQEQTSGTLIMSEDRLFDGYSLGGASVSERLSRLAKVFPKDTMVLMIVRNPEDYLKQYYKHLVMTEGLGIRFADWIRYLLVRGSKSFLGLLDYASLLKAAQEHFADVEILLYEQISEDQELVHKHLATRGISMDAPLGVRDADDYEDARVAHMLRLIATAGSVSGHPALTTDVGDLKTYAENSPMFEALLLDDAVQKAGIENMRDASAKLVAADPTATIDFSLDLQSQQMLTGYMAQVNTALAAHTGLPLAHYGYELGDAGDGPEEEDT